MHGPCAFVAPTVSPTQATLIALEVPVRVSRVSSGAETPLNKDEAVTIEVNDEVIGAGERSWCGAIRGSRDDRCFPQHGLQAV